jgi:uncharacterized protein YndB with AHSA1/START domain/uncharacterized protein YciI
MERMIRKEVVVQAPVADVWRAWTTRDGIKSFFGADAKVELKVGGPYEVYFLMDAPEGSRGSDGCCVLSFLPNRMLSFSWNAPPSMPNVRKERTHVVLTFHELAGGRTRVELTHLGWGTGAEWDQAFEYFTKAWGSVLASLQKRFAPQGESGKPIQQFIYFIEPTRATFTQDATEAENARIEEHFRYLQRLLADGTLILAGRTMQDQPVGIVIFEASDEDAAKKTFENDPAVKAGVFKGRVAPYRVALQRQP